ACDTPAVLAAYREFEHQFASKPVMILNLSFFSANDSATGIVGDELLWQLGFRERARLGGLSRAMQTLFLPEKVAWQNLIWFWPNSPVRYTEAGFESAPAHANVAGWSPELVQLRAGALQEWWYDQPSIDG